MPQWCASWGKRVAAAGFLFFLVKGLLWLVVGAVAATGVWSIS